MHNALAFVHERKVSCRATAAGHVGVQGLDLFFADRVGDAVVAVFPAGGGGVVVGRGNDRADTPHLAPGLAQALISLRAGDFVHQVAVDVQNGGAVFFGVDDVFVPDFVIKGAGHCLIQRVA